MSDGEAVILRLLYTGISCYSSIISNKFILPNKNHVELINMVKRLIDLDKVMITEVREKTLEKDFDEMELRRIIYSSYLISGRIQMHTNPSDERR